MRHKFTRVPGDDEFCMADYVLPGRPILWMIRYAISSVTSCVLEAVRRSNDLQMTDNGTGIYRNNLGGSLTFAYVQGISGR